MIGLGSKRRVGTGYPDSDVGMLDVSANALAVLILATMMVLTLAAPHSPRGEVPTEDRPALFYPSPLEVVMAPQSAYWIVTQNGLTALDLDAFAEGFAKSSNVVSTDQGEGTLIIDRKIYRDLNDHRLTILPNWATIGAQAAPLASDDALQITVQAMRTSFERDGIVPTFVVESKGTDAFARIYWALRDDQVPMRWTPITEGTNLILSRQVSNFEEPERRWQ